MKRMHMKKLLIIGAGEFADIAYEYFTLDSEYEVVGFSVETEFMTFQEKFNLPVYPLEQLETHISIDEIVVHVAITSTALNSVRERLITQLKAKNYKFANYISSKAFVWRTAEIGDNVFIFENNVIQHGVKIEDGCVLWSGNHIGHQSKIGKFCFLSSQIVISGFCTIGHNSFIGVNSSIADNVKIGPYAIVSMASAVNRSFPSEGLVLSGVPAKPSKVSSFRLAKVDR